MKLATPDLSAAQAIDLMRDAIQMAGPLTESERALLAYVLGSVLSADERPAIQLINTWAAGYDS